MYEIQLKDGSTLFTRIPAGGERSVIVRDFPIKSAVVRGHKHGIFSWPVVDTIIPAGFICYIAILDVERMRENVDYRQVLNILEEGE